MSNQIRRYTDVPPTTMEARDDEPNKIVGHAAVYYDGTEKTEFVPWDNYRERIMPRAFDRAIKEDDVRGLFNHDVNQLLGRTSAQTLLLRSDKIGLWYEALMPPTTAGRDVWASVKRGDVQGNSISFRVSDEREEKKDGIWYRDILGVELFDVGPVTFPAYESTDVQARSLEEAQAWVERHEQRSPRRGRRISILRRRLELDTRQRS